MSKIKGIIRNLLNTLHLDLTQNLKYDRLTKLVLKKVLKSDSVCVDVGCHKGEMLVEMLKYAPNGKHFCFEPIPVFYNDLVTLVQASNVTIYPYALSDESGFATFQFVKNAPAYSGLKKRAYKVEHPDIEEINVELKKLDDVLPKNLKVDLIKIDVEGAEFKVLKGAVNCVKSHQPCMIFEYGLGASDYYEVQPEAFYQLIVEDFDLDIFTLKDFVEDKEGLSLNQFVYFYKNNIEYYFVAFKKNR